MKLFRNKKGIELTINFIVMLILGMAMLSGALVLSSKLFTKAQSYQAVVDKNTQQQIMDIIRDTDSLVVIYPSRKTISRKKSDVFGIGVQNIRTDSQSSGDVFNIALTFNKAYDKDTNVICEDRFDAGFCKEIDSGPNSWINLGNPKKTIDKNDIFTFNTLVSVPKAVPSGILYL